MLLGTTTMTKQNRGTHIRLTSHPGRGGVATRFPIRWGAASARERGPVIGTVNAGADRNAIGAHGGSYALYRALAVSSGALEPDRAARPHQHLAGRRDRPVPAMVRAGAHRLARSVGPSHRGGFPHGDRRGRRYPPDHRGHQGAAHDFRTRRSRGERPPQGRRHDHEGDRRRRRHQGGGRSGLVSARHRGALRRRPRTSCAARCSSRPAACIRSSSRGRISRCSCRRSAASRSTFSAIPSAVWDKRRTLACRVHDECNGSDVFGSDICTCRPYLIHGIEECDQAKRRTAARA